MWIVYYKYQFEPVPQPERFDTEDAALSFAGSLRKRGYDVYISKVTKVDIPKT